MRVLVISDSHGKRNRVMEVVANYTQWGTDHLVDMVVHLGDYDSDLLKYAELFGHVTIVAVAGNGDYGSKTEGERILTLAGHQVLLLHGHKQNVKMGYERLCYHAREKDVRVCLFGHTHKACIFEQDNILFMNPGSLGEPPFNDAASYGILTLEENMAPKAEVITL